VLKKDDLKKRLAVIRRSFDKEVRDREALANKVVSCLPCRFQATMVHFLFIVSLQQAVEQLQKYFKENEGADVYIAALDVDGNSKVFGG